VNPDLLYAKAFRGILLAADVANREEAGQMPPAVIPFARERLLGQYAEFFPAELQRRAEQMAYVYSLFYCFENTMRDLVAKRLEERIGPQWWDSVPERVRKRVDAKQQEAEQNKWHQVSVPTNIAYTLFGDLGSIIVTEWREFEDLFPSQVWVTQRLDELERSRNIVAHGNELSEVEVDRIEQYLMDWVRQVP
jgi:hypothetical protein